VHWPIKADRINQPPSPHARTHARMHAHQAFTTCSAWINSPTSAINQFKRQSTHVLVVRGAPEKTLWCCVVNRRTACGLGLPLMVIRGCGVEAKKPSYLIVDLLPELLAAEGQLDVDHQPPDGLEASAGQPGAGVLLQHQGLPFLHHLGRDRERRMTRSTTTRYKSLFKSSQFIYRAHLKTTNVDQSALQRD